MAESYRLLLPYTVKRKNMNWRTVIRHYRLKHLPNHRAEIRWFANQPTLADAIAKAAHAENHCGKRYNHQRRIPREVLKASFRKLRSKEDAIRVCKSFDKLHDLIKETLKGIFGIGELYCYDTALRIGAKLSLHPQTVLLHAGTRKGASLIADIRGRNYLSKEDLPPELRRLPPEQVEDILCIYKDRIKKMHNKPIQPTA